MADVTSVESDLIECTELKEYMAPVHFSRPTSIKANTNKHLQPKFETIEELNVR